MFFFFFSSRRRHTRCSRDWSSDVCSSDLISRRRWAYWAETAERWPRPIIRVTSAADVTSASRPTVSTRIATMTSTIVRSEEHTSELQSRLHLVCRLLLEKKKYKQRVCSTDEQRHAHA